MAKGRLVIVGEVLSDLDAYMLDGHALHVAPAEKTTLRAESRCAVLDVYETDDPDDDPAFATKHGLTYLMMMDAVGQVLTNSSKQLGRAPTEAEMLAALNHYAEHDAFIRHDR